MKGLCLTVFLGLVVIFNGCGTTHAMTQTGSPGSVKNPQMQAFFGLGEVVQTVNGIRVTLSADEIFKKHSTLLNHDGTAKVDAIAAALLKYPGVRVLVTGYTDNDGTDMKNVKFSSNRAGRVMGELLKQGVPAENVNAMGSGPVESVAPNNSAANKAKNRRIVFDITAQ